MQFIKRFEEVNMKDLPLVGGKNASLGPGAGRWRVQGGCRASLK